MVHILTINKNKANNSFSSNLLRLILHIFCASSSLLITGYIIKNHSVLILNVLKTIPFIWLYLDEYSLYLIVEKVSNKLKNVSFKELIILWLYIFILRLSLIKIFFILDYTYLASLLTISLFNTLFPDCNFITLSKFLIYIDLKLSGYPLLRFRMKDYLDTILFYDSVKTIKTEKISVYNNKPVTLYNKILIWKKNIMVNLMDALKFTDEQKLKTRNKVAITLKPIKEKTSYIDSGFSKYCASYNIFPTNNTTYKFLYVCYKNNLNINTTIFPFIHISQPEVNLVSTICLYKPDKSAVAINKSFSLALFLDKKVSLFSFVDTNVLGLKALTTLNLKDYVCNKTSLALIKANNHWLNFEVLNTIIKLSSDIAFLDNYLLYCVINKKTPYKVKEVKYILNKKKLLLNLWCYKNTALVLLENNKRVKCSIKDSKELIVYSYLQNDRDQIMFDLIDFSDSYDIISIKNKVSAAFYIELEKFYLKHPDFCRAIDPELFTMFDYKPLQSGFYIKIIKNNRYNKGSKLESVPNFGYIEYHNNIYLKEASILLKRIPPKYYINHSLVYNPKPSIILPFWEKVSWNEYKPFNIPELKGSHSNKTKGTLLYLKKGKNNWLKIPWQTNCYYINDVLSMDNSKDNAYKIENYLKNNLDKNLASLYNIKNKLDKKFYDQVLKLYLDNRGLCSYNTDALIVINEIELSGDLSVVVIDGKNPDFTGFSEKIKDKHQEYNPYISTVYKNADIYIYMRLKDTYANKIVHIVTPWLIKKGITLLRIDENLHRNLGSSIVNSRTEFSLVKKFVWDKLNSLYRSKKYPTYISMSDSYYKDIISVYDHNIVCKSILDADSDLQINIVVLDKDSSRYNGPLTIKLLKVLSLEENTEVVSNVSDIEINTEVEPYIKDNSYLNPILDNNSVIEPYLLSLDIHNNEKLHEGILNLEDDDSSVLSDVGSSISVSSSFKASLLVYNEGSYTLPNVKYNGGIHDGFSKSNKEEERMENEIIENERIAAAFIEADRLEAENKNRPDYDSDDPYDLYK